MRLAPYLSLLLACSPLLCAAQTSTLSSASSMRAIYVQDQRDRGVPLADNGIDVLPAEAAKKLPPINWDDVPKRDEERRKQVAEMLQQDKLITGEDFYDASFIYQHGQTADDYLLAHVLAMEAMVRGERRAKWVAAATLDRYLQQIGQKQVFGTQYLDTFLAYYLEHRHDADIVPRMKAMQAAERDATQQPYNEILLPPVTRRDFCVPPLTDQQTYIRDTNAGKSTNLPRLTNCDR